MSERLEEELESSLALRDGSLDARTLRHVVVLLRSQQRRGESCVERAAESRRYEEAAYYTAQVEALGRAASAVESALERVAMPTREDARMYFDECAAIAGAKQ